MIERFREMIEHIDNEIMELIVQRNDIAAEIGSYKRNNGIDITDVSVERKVIQRYRKHAEENGIDPDTMEEICLLLIRLSKERQSSS